MATPPDARLRPPAVDNARLYLPPPKPVPVQSQGRARSASPVTSVFVTPRPRSSRHAHDSGAGVRLRIRANLVRQKHASYADKIRVSRWFLCKIPNRFARPPKLLKYKGISDSPKIRSPESFSDALDRRRHFPSPSHISCSRRVTVADSGSWPRKALAICPWDRPIRRPS